LAAREAWEVYRADADADAADAAARGAYRAAARAATAGQIFLPVDR